MRQLSTIQKIDNLEPIKGADRIELATIKGWKVIVQKGLYNIGDKVIYCEVDSFLPVEPQYEFLRQSSFKIYDGKEGFRIKTMKMKGIISQGLIIPLSVLGNKGLIDCDASMKIGQNVTDMLGIIKYDTQAIEEKKINETQKSRVPKISKYGFVQKWYSKFYLWYHRNDITDKQFPSFIPKTDEERVQNLVGKLNEHKDKRAYISEKLDGCSVTFYLYKDKFGVCSRNIDLQKSKGNHYWKVAIKYDIENKLRKYGKNIAIQGEIVGPNIQGNKYKLDELKFYVHNIFDIEEQKNYSPAWMEFSTKSLGLETVPYIGESQIGFVIEERISSSKGESVLYKTHREGIVVRTSDGELSFKAINPDFLLSNDE